MKEPCLATGNQRLVEIAWNGKIGDKGPTFKVTNNAKHDVLYGNVLLYFYDQAGKQLEVGPAGKTKKRLQCAGNIFAGAVKPGEKIFVNFSCCKKDDVPEGAVTIEGELKTAGFADASGGRSDTYWQNTDLVPEDRPKGGIK